MRRVPVLYPPGADAGNDASHRDLRDKWCPEPCGKCVQCVSILDGSNPDVMEIDAASNNAVDDVRRLRESVGFATMTSRYRVVILDEAHMMTKSAFNAFLKTLEEPPPGVVFVLATTELHKVPETIRSRCQVLLFRRVGEQDLCKRLRMIADREGVTVADEVLAEIAGSVRGGVRDAETALERVLPLAREAGATFDLQAYRTLVARVGLDAVIAVVESLLAGDARAGLHFARELQQHGTDEREALGELVEVLRWLQLLKVDGADSGLVPVSGAMRERLVKLAAEVPSLRLDAMLGAGLLGRERLRRLEDRGAVFEVALVRMAQAGALPMLGELLAAVRSGGGVAGPAPVAPARQPFGSGARPIAAPAAQAAGPGTPAASPTGDLRTRTLALLKDRQLLHAVIELCRFDGPNAQGVLVVTLQTDRKMYRDRLAAQAQQQDLTKVIHEAAGRPLTVDWRLPEIAASGPAPAPAASVEPGPQAKRVMGAFRGRVVQVNPQDRVQAEGPARPADDDGAPVDEQPPNLPE